MKNLDLECVPVWRFCNIPHGQKGPRYAGWQTRPYRLEQIDPMNNVGVLLGPLSGGLCALDFDGTTAWSWFSEQFPDLTMPATIAWTSGRTDRCQMAFRVPEAYWDYLKTLKIATGESEGFEFRWTGGQSVVPPSVHPITQQEYFWVQAPSVTDLAELPDAILSYWLLQANPAPATLHTGAEMPPPTGDEIAEIYQDLKRFYPTLGYDRWSIATWVACRELGPNDGLALMKYLWPEERAGEYANLLKTVNKSSKPAGIGSIITWIRQHDANYQPTRTYTGLQALQKLKQERYRIKNLARKFIWNG